MHHRTATSRLSELFIAIVALLFVLPVALVFVTSLKSDAEVVKFDSILPGHPTAENFRYVMGTPEEIPILRWLGNSIFVSSSVTLLVLLVDSLAAYALAWLDLPGRRWAFALIIATLMVPGQILLIPVYLILNHLGWIDSLAAVIVPQAAGAFGVFLLHQFFKAIPRELREAAEIDGCNRLQTWWHVMLPLIKPALATLAIFTFIGSWNDFLGPLVFLDSVEHYTLPVGVALFQSSYASQYGLTFAASVICTAPMIVVFLIFSRQIIKGLSAGAVKE